MPHLIGPYSSSLTQYAWQALLALLQQNLAEGEYAGGTLFDKTAAEALLAQGQDFSSLPLPSAGSRAYAGQINYPLSLLQARYQAIGQETTAFSTAMQQFLTVLSQDAELIDRLLYAADLHFWTSQQSPLFSASDVFSYDFLAAHGPQNVAVNQVDPVTSGSYVDAVGNLLPLETVSFGFSDFIYGVSAPLQTKTASAPIRLTWTLNEPPIPPDRTETLYAEDNSWASLAILPEEPLLNFQAPVATVILPPNQPTAQVVALRGTSNTGNLPVTVRILFVPRSRILTVPITTAGQTVELSVYNISTDDLMVFDVKRSYFVDQDFTLNVTAGSRLLTAKSSLVGQTVSILFTEYFPGYQCSINTLDWSPIVLFDPENPFPDPANIYFPLQVKDGWYPIMDELGKPLGIEFQPLQLFLQEYTLAISASASSNYGALATLEIEFANPAYMNAVHLNPFTDMPMRLIQIGAIGINTASDPEIVYQGNLLIDREMSVRFASSGANVYTTRLFLTFQQNNYSLEQLLIDSPNQLRKQTLGTLQSIIPFAERSSTGSLPQIDTGVEYDFGVRDLAGECWTMNNPGLGVYGPFTVEGSPQVLQLNTLSSNDRSLGRVDSYLLYQIFDGNGVGQGVVAPGAALPSGTSVSFPNLVGGSYSGTISKVDFYLKFVFRDPLSILSRFYLQVSK